MKGYRKHIAASASITLVFVVCALAISVSAVPMSPPPVQASQVSGNASLAGGLTNLVESLDQAYRKTPVEESTPPAAVVEPVVQPAPATAVTQPAPAITEPVAELDPAAPQSAAPDESASKKINPPTNLAGMFVAEVPPYISLTWNGNNSSKDLSYFLIYRKDADVPGEVSITQSKKEKYDDYDIKPGHTYQYTVTAVAKWGEESGPSNAIKVATMVMDPPASPRDVIAMAIDPGVSLDWQPNGEANLAGYNVYYSRNGRWRQLNSAILTDNHYYYDQGIAGQTYAVSAVNVFGIESGYTVVAAQEATPVIYEESDPAVSVEGMWVVEKYVGASGGQILVAGTAGEKLRFNFTGRQVKLISANYWTCGDARIYIDGELMGTVSMYSQDPVFNTTDVSVPGLKYGQHVLTVEVVGSGNPETTFNFVNVDAFEVR